MKRILLALTAALISTQALAQTQFPASTLWGNFTGSTGLPTTVTVPNCPAGALNFTPGTGFGCGALSGSGVTSLGGMTGVITCGANMTCTGGQINSTGGGSTPALPSTHIFVGNGSNQAADYQGLATFTPTGTMTLTPTSGTFTPGLIINQQGPITGSQATSAWYNKINIQDDYAVICPNCALNGLTVNIDAGIGGGGNLSGARQAFTSNVNVRGPISALSRNSWMVGGAFGAFDDVSPCGTGSFTGNISGATLTVTGFSGASIKIGDPIFVPSGPQSGATIQSFGSGTGGNGNYTITGTPVPANGPMQSGCAIGTSVFNSYTRGSFAGINPVVAIADNVTNITGVTGEEIDISTGTGATMQTRVGMAVILLDSITGGSIINSSGSAVDYGLYYTGTASSLGWQYGIRFDRWNGGGSNGAPPVRAGGTIMGSGDSWTVANVFDFSSLTVTGAFLRGPGNTFVVDGTGQITTSITGATRCLQVNSAGVVSGTASACGTSSGSIPALVHTHLFVGDATNTAADFGTRVTIADTGVLTLTPSALNNAIVVNQNTGASSPATTTGLQVIGADAGGATVQLDSFAGSGTPSSVYGTRAGGTQASKVPLGAGFSELVLRGLGYNGSAYVANIQLSLLSDNAQGAADSSSYFSFLAIPKTSTTIQQVATLWGSGGLAVGNANAGSDPGAGRILATNLTLTGLAGTGSRCMHADAAGAVTATVSDCGTSGGGITGISSTNSTLTIGGTTALTMDINLGHANTWTALQTHTGGVTTNTLTVSGLTAGGLVFAGAGGALSTDSSIYFDAASKRLCAGGISLANCTETASGLTGTVANIQGTNGSNAWVIWNSSATPKQVFQMRPSATGAGIFDLTDAAGTAQAELRGDAGLTFLGGAGPVAIGGAAALTGVAGELAVRKITDPNTAPGTQMLKLTVEAGTTGGSCKIVARAGTSATPVTVIDNVGAGC